MSNQRLKGHGKVGKSLEQALYKMAAVDGSCENVPNASDIKEMQNKLPPN